jgi:methanogenic corrinoid protein MtbC1
MPEALINAIVEMKEAEAISLAKELLDEGSNPNEILNMGVEAMGIIGDRFEAGQYFLPELLMAGEIMEAINELALPLMGGGDSEVKGEKVVLGTVSGDVHDIGKNIVRFMLEANGYSVVDVGTDVPAETFVNSVKESGASFVGLSALLTVSYDTMKETVDALDNAGLRDQTKVMIGGAPVDDKVLEYVNADARGGTAVAAVHLVDSWVEGKEN